MMQTRSDAVSGGRLALAIPLSMLAAGAAPAMAQDVPRYHGPHMWDGAWWMFFGPISMLLFLGAFVAGVVLLVRWLTATGNGGKSSSSVKTPLDILEERFARGEIDKDEFEERRRVLDR